jgi:hypothetical protein
MNIPALLGSISLILFLIKREKDQHDNNPKYKKSWRAFFVQNWDDFVLALISGQILVLLQEPAYFGLVRFMDWDFEKCVDIYFDSEEAIAFVVGFSATFLIGWLYKYVIKKTKNEEA